MPICPQKRPLGFLSVASLFLSLALELRLFVCLQSCPLPYACKRPVVVLHSRQSRPPPLPIGCLFLGIDCKRGGVLALESVSEFFVQSFQRVVSMLAYSRIPEITQFPFGDSVRINDFLWPRHQGQLLVSQVRGDIVNLDPISFPSKFSNAHVEHRALLPLSAILNNLCMITRQSIHVLNALPSDVRFQLLAHHTFRKEKVRNRIL
mmetsp:Transcript_29821/g.69694  ORF Transcript_29821/g.69694 Transcript_29821/m.69694 type:complete len:206 (+) Transcript_29821:104-721(+)